MKCDACGAELSDDCAFCSNCGRPVRSPDEERSSRPPRVPAELVREREQRAEAALQLERARLQGERDEIRGRRAFMIGVFVLALLASAMLTIVVNRLRGPGQLAAPQEPGRTGLRPRQRAGIQLNNISLARGCDAEGLPTEPVNILRLGLDTEVFCFLDVVGASGELALSVEWWRLGAKEHQTDLTLEFPVAEPGAREPTARHCIPLRVPSLSQTGTWEIRFVHEGQQVGVLPLRVQDAVA